MKVKIKNFPGLKVQKSKKSDTLRNTNCVFKKTSFHFKTYKTASFIIKVEIKNFPGLKIQKSKKPDTLRNTNCVF